MKIPRNFQHRRRLYRWRSRANKNDYFIATKNINKSYNVRVRYRISECFVSHLFCTVFRKQKISKSKWQSFVLTSHSGKDKRQAIEHTSVPTRFRQEPVTTYSTSELFKYLLIMQAEMFDTFGITSIHCLNFSRKSTYLQFSFL